MEEGGVAVAFREAAERVERGERLLERLHELVAQLRAGVRDAQRRAQLVFVVPAADWESMVVAPARAQLAASAAGPLRALAAAVHDRGLAEALRYRFSWEGAVGELAALLQLLAFARQKRALMLPEVVEELAALAAGGVRPPVESLLDADPYLLSLIQLVNHLARLAVTCATRGDFDAVGAVGRVANDVAASLQRMHLKNGDVRRRFDSVKYDVKRIEQVLYDLRVRRIAVDPVAVAAEAAPPAPSADDDDGQQS